MSDNQDKLTEEQRIKARRYLERARKAYNLKTIGETKPSLLEPYQIEELAKMNEAMEASVNNPNGYSPLEIIAIKKGTYPRG